MAMFDNLAPPECGVKIGIRPDLTRNGFCNPIIAITCADPIAV